MFFPAFYPILYLQAVAAAKYKERRKYTHDKKEFNQKFDSTFDKEMNELFTESSINQITKPYIDQNGNIPFNQIAAFALVESTMITKRILKSVFENILEFDD